MKLCVKNDISDNSNIEERIESLEKKIELISSGKVGIEKTKEPKMEVKPENTVTRTNVKSVNPIEKGGSAWSNVLDSLKKSGKLVLYTNLLNSKAIEINDMTLGIQFSKPLTGFAKTVLESIDNRHDLETAVAMQYGKQMNIKYIVQNEGESCNTKNNNSNNPLEDLGIPINVIEE